MLIAHKLFYQSFSRQRHAYKLPPQPLQDLDYWWFCRRLPDETLPRTRAGWFQRTEPLQNPIVNVTAELYDWVYDNVTNATYEVERPDLGGCFGQGPGETRQGVCGIAKRWLRRR